MIPASRHVAVIGASDNPERYSYKAVKLLAEKGYMVYPVHPRLKDIEGLKVFGRLEETPPVGTVSIYVGPDISSGLEESLIAKHPDRVIFNPGAENFALAEKLNAAGIKTLNACTLVMLRTGQF